MITYVHKRNSFRLWTFIFGCGLQKDTYETLHAIKKTGANGVIVWGSSDDLNSKYAFGDVSWTQCHSNINNYFLSIYSLMLDQNVISFSSTWKTSWARSQDHCKRCWSPLKFKHRNLEWMSLKSSHFIDCFSFAGLE